MKIGIRFGAGLSVGLLMASVLFFACGKAEELPSSVSSTSEEQTSELPVDVSVFENDTEESTDAAIVDPSSAVLETSDLTTSSVSSEVSGTEVSTDLSTSVATTTERKELTSTEALALFNDATKAVVSQKAGYKKVRYTKITKLDFGALGGLDVVKGAAYGFFGVDKGTGEGTQTYENKKGETSAQFVASKLTMSDISSVTAKPLDDGGYEITVKVQNGSTKWTGSGRGDAGSGTKRTYMDNGPLYVADGNNKDVDHKTAQNMYAGINGEGDKNAETKGIGEQSKNCVYVAKLDQKGNIVKLTADFDIYVDILDVKYTVVSLKNKSGGGYSKITYSEFQY